VRRQHLAGARLDDHDRLAGIRGILGVDRTRHQHAVDTVMRGDAVRIGRGHRHGFEHLVRLRIADDDDRASHAGEIPAVLRLGEGEILADDAAGNGDDLGPVRETCHVEHPQFGTAKRGDIGPFARWIVEDVVRDQIRRQRNLGKDLTVVRRCRVELDKGDALLAKGLLALGFIEDECRLLRLRGDEGPGERGGHGDCCGCKCLSHCRFPCLSVSVERMD